MNRLANDDEVTSLQQVELRVLGPLQVRQYGLPVAIPGAKPRAILTMLGLHAGSVVSADAFVELLWGAEPPRTAAKALQTHISSLRRALGDGFVVTAGTGWTVTTTDIDASRYLTAVSMGREAIASGDGSQAVAHFDEALALWRGLPELPEGSRGTSEKTRWIEGHAALVEDRADALLATGRAAEIVGELEAAISDAPMRERRWGQLMLALYRAGRQGEALGAYQRVRTLLADELGVDPGPDLRRLEAAIVAQDAALETPVSQRLQSVMRAVTFLLTDIEGSTAAWEADSDAMAVALARHDEIVEQVVTSRAGRLIKTRGEGDATFSVFDRPSAAAAAAIELQEAIRHEPWSLAEPMRIRVALHTGEVELRDGDYFGRAVNRAARLRSLAAGGQILCSGATSELVVDTLADDVVLADLGMRQLKNLARPEHVFELRLENANDLRAPATDVPIERPGLPTVLAGPGPFVGRGPELERLLSAWQTTFVEGARAVLIAGEPGVGKTRLAGEWSRHAHEQGAMVLYGRCDEDLGAPYQPFAEALRSLVPCLGARRLQGLRGVEALLPLVPDLADDLPDVAAPTRADPDTERYALFDAVVAMLRVASASAPVVLILDDLHWASKPTLLLLRHLLRFGEQARVQIVGTYRSTDLDRSHPLAAMLADLHRDGSASRLALGGLDEGDVTAYVAEAGYDEELARALASVTGGNPFFLIEALRHVDESGGRWDPSTLPQGVREAVSRRLSRLPVETNKALAAAAVVGSRFPLALVESVVGKELVDAFDEASKAGIVIEEPGGRYRFNHAIVRRSLLAELPSVRRMRLHQKIAATLETEPGADDELLAELAYHYFECAWAGNAPKAVEYCRRAADQSMARLAYEGAADLYDKAVHALEEIDDELSDRGDQKAELLVARCEALLAAGDVVSATGAVAQLQDAAGSSARIAAWGTCFDGQLSMLTDPGRLDEIESALGAAAEKLAGLDDAQGEAKAQTVRAECLARLGRFGDCETALDQALTAARRAGEHRRVNAVLANAPLAALWGPNPVPRAGGRCLDVVRLLRITTGSPVVEATSTRCQGVLDAFRGRAAAGRSLIDSARRTLTELGMRHALLEVDQFAGIVELVADDPAAAEPYLRRAYNGFRRMRLDADTAETAALLARVCLALDRDAEADELCTESERLAGHALKASIAWRTVRAQLLARDGAPDEARRVAEEAVALAGRTDALVDHGDACLALAAVLDAAGDKAGMRTAAGRAVELYELKGATALAEKAHELWGDSDLPGAPVSEEPPIEELDAAVAELDAAQARLEGHLRSPLENAASRADARFNVLFSDRRVDEIGRMFVDDLRIDDRRRGLHRVGIGRANELAEVRALADLGVETVALNVVAVRGDRLALIHTRAETSGPEAFDVEFLRLAEVDSDERFVACTLFDLDELDAAVAELDARYRAGEAAPYQNTWSVIVEAYASVRRGELPAMTPDWVNVDHRRTAVAIAPGDLTGYLHATWELDQDVRPSIEVVHRLTGRGAVVTYTARGTSPAGFDGEWREISLSIVDGDLISRCELFDEADLDAALARFDELNWAAPRLGNAASNAGERFLEQFAAGNWEVMTGMLADDYSSDDRRRVVNAGIQQGRDAEILNMHAVGDLWFTNVSTKVIGTRGERLSLGHARYSGRDQGPEGGFFTDILGVVEINSDERISSLVVFDPDDLDAAFAELDARYLAGEAADHAHTWSVITGALAAVNRHELPKLAPNWVNNDHRRAIAFAPGDMTAYMHATWDLGPDGRAFIEAVHRLSNLGALVTQVGHEISPQGFEAEWRLLNLGTIEGDQFNCIELFDEADIDAALARFDQLSRPTSRLENAASQVYERFWTSFAARDWDAMAHMLSDDYSADDRRQTVNAGVLHGRDAEIANLRAIAEMGVKNVTPAVVATRGDRLALDRFRLSDDEGPEGFYTEVLGVIEIDADERMVGFVMLDVDDIDAAFEELDARYVAGEAAPHVRTWSMIADGYAGFNRRELLATTPEWTSVDHRRGASFAPGDMIAYIHAAWDDSPDTKIYIAAVHRLSDVGGVVTHVGRGVSQEGFDAEWRDVHILTVEGQAFSSCELFDESDLDAALARFDELGRPAPTLENAASRIVQHLGACFADQDWNALAETLSDDVSTDDRRRVVGAGVRHGRDAEMASLRATAEVGTKSMTGTVMATRGDRLVLSRVRFSGRNEGAEDFLAEVLGVIEINVDERIGTVVVFDLDDVDAAFGELDARYLAGEAAAHAHTWSVIARGYAALNRREIPATSPDWVNIDHRRSTSFEPGDLAPYIRSLWDVASDVAVYIETVHRVSDFGALVSSVTRGRSREGFDAEWPEINLLAVDGELITRAEFFDETDLDVALERFDELDRPAPRLGNAACRVGERYLERFSARDWNAMAEMLADDFSSNDRRRVVGAGIRHGRDAEIASMRAISNVGLTNARQACFAERGGRLTLSRVRFSGRDHGPETVVIDALGVVEVNADNRIAATVVFDADDIDAAFDELDARYLGGEAATNSHTWSVIARGIAAFNRRELPGFTPDSVNIDHRRARGFAPGDLTAYIGATWDLAPDVSAYAEAVHRLSNRGAVWTHAVSGTSRDGFDAEWREICLATVEGDLINRIEMFEAEDLDAALARFDELNRPAQRLENAASQVSDRLFASFATRDWATMSAMLADGFYGDDRRQGMNVGLHDRDAVIESFRTGAEFGIPGATTTVLATRAKRLVLAGVQYVVSNEDPDAFHIDLLQVVEIDDDERISGMVTFDIDEIGAAFEELDARYLAGETAAHSRTWLLIVEIYAGLNRHELPATTPDWVNVDHRHVTTMAPGDLMANLRASWDLTPQTSYYVEAVHRLTDHGAVFTHLVSGTSQEGFQAEWRIVDVLTFDGDLVNRSELFDEADLDAALARFDELNRQAP